MGKLFRFGAATPKIFLIAMTFKLAAALGCVGITFAGQSRGNVPATPIKHLVVIFQENVSFDHYFATYPNATNPSGEPSFNADPNTPTVNNLIGVLLSSNPNQTNPANASLPKGANPFRLDRSQAATCDQGHNYMPEQVAFDLGLMDNFPIGTGATGCASNFDYSYGHGTGIVMGYFDGNTVTAFWNYAQSFAMSDNSYGTMFGPSTPGALNLIAGNTSPATPSSPSTKVVQ